MAGNKKHRDGHDHPCVVPFVCTARRSEGFIEEEQMKSTRLNCQSMKIAAIALVVASMLGVWHESEANNLTQVLGSGLSIKGQNFSTTSVAPAISPAIATAISQAVTQEFPLTSVSPSYTFRYDSTLGVYERSTTVPGPLFSERALTLGKGQFNFGLGYSYIDFDTLNGKDLDHLTVPVLGPTLVGPEVIPNPNEKPTVFYRQVAEANPVIRLKIQAHVIVPTFRFGVTDNWDVGIAIPILNTSLTAQTDFQEVVRNPGDVTSPSYFQSPTFGGGFVYTEGMASNGYIKPNKKLGEQTDLLFSQSQKRDKAAHAAGSSTGVGDISLRSKYCFWCNELGGSAFGLNLQLPSGDKDNFQGTGETHVSPFLYASYIVWNRLEPHLNVGVDFNTGDVDNSSFVYAVGFTGRLADSLGVMFDILGRSEFGRSAVVPPKRPCSENTQGCSDLLNNTGFLNNFPLSRAPSTCTPEHPCSLNGTQPRVVSYFFPQPIKRNDIIDISVGLRYGIGTHGSAFFGAVLPLNEDGFRANFIPSGGIEYTF
jgi:hypothetical protein